MRISQINFKHGSRGMSLVELMLVMAILSVVMMAVMSLYVPAHQSTVAQSQVADVQGNLRLAAATMTKDILTAGFLVPEDSIVFEASGTDVTTPDDHVDFTIRTRAVGSAFARVEEDATDGASAGDIRMKVTEADMLDAFTVGSQVRLFEPMTGEEINEGVGADDERVYSVTDIDSANRTIDIDPGTVGTTKADVLAESIIIRVPNNQQPPIQRIRYRLVNGALAREVNGNVQLLARNMDSVWFDYDRTPQDRVKKIDIQLVGKTQELKDDAISGEKTRKVTTSVTLRNIF